MCKLLEIHVIDNVNKKYYFMLQKALDHAHFYKNDVFFNKTTNELIIKLKRYKYDTKAHKKFLGIISIWSNRIPPTISCILSIKDIESHYIFDDDPDNPRRQEVITGGLIIFNKYLMNIGSFCEHENPYNISIIPRRINVTLKDV